MSRRVLLWLLLILGVSTWVYGDTPISQSPPLNIEEDDDSPSVYPYKLIVTDGTLTDNGDGTATLATGAGGGSGDITAVGDVATGAAFNGTAGTTITFNDADGDQTLSYDTTANNFEFTDDVDLTDGSGASPALISTPATGTAWSIYTEDTGDDLQIESNTASTETIDIVNVGAGVTNVTLDGDLTISGDDLVMGTNTDGAVLVADGTNFNPVDMSGDVDIANTGATTIQANSVALTTDTTGNYAAGDAEAGSALTGDSATAFFSAGQIEAARGGTGDDTSATTGVPRIDGGNWTYAELSGDVVTSGSNATTIQANSVALTTDTTGNYVADVAGTSNEITSTHTPGEGSTATISLPATIDLGGKTSFEVPNAADPTTDAFGELAADNDAWAASRGALEHFDGTASTFVVAALASDAPSDGQVPKWNTGGTITWEADSGGAGSKPPQNLWWMASSLEPLEAADSIPPLTKYTGTNQDILVCSYDKDTDEGRKVHFKVPSDLDTTGTVTLRNIWMVRTTTTGTAKWDWRISQTGAQGETWDQTFLTQATITPATGTANQFVITSTNVPVVTTGWSVNDEITMMVYRDANSTGDTVNVDAENIAVGAEIPRS